MNRGLLLRDERGQTSVEYALVLGVAIAVALLLAAGLADGVFQGFWDKIGSVLG
jgi:Flp pilus assembly pilin Flp